MNMRSDKKLRHHALVTGNRLRMIRAEFADEEPQVRAGYLREEIERVLKKILPGTRKEFLEALMARFPTGEFTGDQASQPTESAADEDILNDSDYLVDLLLKVAPTLTEDRKNLIVDRLRAVGIGSEKAKVYSDESLGRLKAALKLGDAVSIDADRVIEIAVLLAEFVGAVEPLVWNVWHGLSPQSRSRASGDVTGTLRKLLSSDEAVSPSEAKRDLTVLRQLIHSLVAATSRVGSQFARKHLGKFSESAIRAFVREEGGGGWTKSEQYKCWEKYCELANGLTEDSIDMEIRMIIAQYVESLMKRTGD